MTEQELTKIEKRAAAATKGPWDYHEIEDIPDPGEEPPRWWEVGQEDSDSHLLIVEVDIDREYDAEFIAYSREDIPKLLRTIRHERANIGALEEQLKLVIHRLNELEHNPRVRVRSQLGQKPSYDEGSPNVPATDIRSGLEE